MMGYLVTGIDLFYEWVVTFFIFTLIDKFFLKKKIMDIIKNNDTYLSSLVVSAFLIILRGQDLSFFAFLFWTFIVMILYTVMGILFRIYVNQ